MRRIVIKRHYRILYYNNFLKWPINGHQFRLNHLPVRSDPLHCVLSADAERREALRFQTDTLLMASDASSAGMNVLTGPSVVHVGSHTIFAGPQPRISQIIGVATRNGAAQGWLA